MIGVVLGVAVYAICSLAYFVIIKKSILVMHENKDKFTSEQMSILEVFYSLSTPGWVFLSLAWPLALLLSIKEALTK